jgi:tetratricopeptide (TPR) repeat protein
MKRVSMGLSVLALFAATTFAGDAAQGIALYKDGRYAEAEAQLRGAPGGEARAYLAAALERLDRHVEAEAEANAVLEAEATQPVALGALGESLVKQEKLDEAVSRMTAALGHEATLAYAYYWRGQAYQRKKQIARMVDDFQHFVKLAPDAPEAPAIKVLLASLK